MRHSLRITQAEVQQMFRLLGECRELGDDPVMWRQHFYAGLSRLVGAELVMSAEVTNILHGTMRMPGGTVWGLEHGFNAAGYMELGQMFAEDSTRSEMWGAQVAAVRKDPAAGITAARQHVLNDHAWNRSFDCERIARLLGTDATMFSLLPTRGEDRFEGLNLTRSPGGRKFNEREVAILRLVHLEVARMIGGPLARFEEHAPSQLPVRVRQVLRCLLEGDSDKQIAARLQLSQHTVNQYTKKIYLYFQVSGRVELLARWLRRGWSNQAAWDVQTTIARWNAVDTGASR